MMMDESCFWVGVVAGTATWVACGLFWKWVDRVRRSRRRKHLSNLSPISFSDVFKKLTKAADDGYEFELNEMEIVVDHNRKAVTICPLDR